MIASKISIFENCVKFCFCLGKNKIDFLEKSFKEKDIFTIMEFDFPVYENTNIENWRGRYEQSNMEGKKYIIKYKPKNDFERNLNDAPCKMKFKYLEDYQKMKKLQEKLAKINRKMDNRNQPFGSGYRVVKDFVYELYEEMLDLEEFVKKCNFLKVDYDDGRFYTIRVWSINTFLAQGDHKFEVFNSLLGCLLEREYLDLYENLKNDICPRLLKIYDSLIQRGLLSLN